jgi:hypothetical protein
MIGDKLVTLGGARETGVEDAVKVLEGGVRPILVAQTQPKPQPKPNAARAKNGGAVRVNVPPIATATTKRTTADSVAQPAAPATGVSRAALTKAPPAEMPLQWLYVAAIVAIVLGIAFAGDSENWQ